MAAGGVSNGSHPPTRLEGRGVAIVVCWFLGLGSLISWNSMLTIGDYYYSLFPGYHPSRVLTLVYQPFAVGTIVLLAYHEATLNTRKRNLAGYILFFLSTFALLLLDLGTSGKGGIANFLGICVLVGAFGVADAHVQGGMVGDLSLMQPEPSNVVAKMQSFFCGLAASGALTSGLRLMTKAAFENTNSGTRKGVIMFLAIAAFFEFLCIFLYAFVFPKLPVVKYYRAKAASEGSKTVTADLAVAGIKTGSNDEVHERLNNKQLLIQNYDYFLDIFLIYVLTLSIFPGFLYENTGHHQLGDWYALVLIAMFNVFDLIARYTPLIDCLRIESRKGLFLATISRVLLIPCFYFTAKYADQGWMIFLTSFLGLTNGHLTVCVMMAAPRGYKGPEQNAIGNLLVVFLMAGIFSGVSLDWLWIIGNGSF